MTEPNTSNTLLLTISETDIIRLIQAHLTEAGLHKTVQTLQEESGGVGMAGTFQSNWSFHASSGQWTIILQSLRLLDRQRCHVSSNLIAAVHEMVILEVAEAGDLTAAYALYRLEQGELLQSPSDDDPKITRGRLLEQKLAALAAARVKDPKSPIPLDFYGSLSKQERREIIGQELQDAVPVQPRHRLTSLLQQAIKWQTYTGEIPKIKQWWSEDGDDNEDAEATSKPRKKRKHFDLVLGHAHVDEVPIDDATVAVEKENIPSEVYSVVKFGKKATAESSAFLPDGSGLVTGSSDGLIEIWDAAHNYTQLRMDLPYQQKEELLGHDAAVTALALSNDGTLLASGSIDGIVNVWRVDTGKCLRRFAAHEQSSVSCVALAPDGSRVLTACRAGICREFGLRANRMLKEFRGHTAYISSCSYVLSTERLFVVTGSGDGTVRLWDSQSQDVVRILRPSSIGPNLSAPETTIATVNTSDAAGDSPAIHSVLHLHTPESTMIVVPRGCRAFLVNYSGVVLRIFEDDGLSSGKVFVAAAVSHSNQHLFIVKEDGVCCVFNVASGTLEASISDFGKQTIKMQAESTSSAEVSSVTSHPNKVILAAFSNDKGQKKGQLVLWK